MLGTQACLVANAANLIGIRDVSSVYNFAVLVIVAQRQFCFQPIGYRKRIKNAVLIVDKTAYSGFQFTIFTMRCFIIYLHRNLTAFVVAHIVQACRVGVRAAIGLCKSVVDKCISATCAPVVVDVCRKLAARLRKFVHIIQLAVVAVKIIAAVGKALAGTLHYAVSRKKLLVLLLISAERALNFYRAEKQNYFIVYHVNGGNAYEWVSGRNSVLIIDEKHFNNPHFHLYTLKPAHIKFRINNYKLAALPEKNNAFISLSGKEYENEILVVRGRINKNSLNHFITKNQVLVIDGSVPARDAQSIKNDKDLAGIEIFDVIREGAFVRNLQLN